MCVRGGIKILKLVFKSIHYYNDFPLSWKNKFLIKDTRNVCMLDKIHTRIQFCDKNFFVHAINLFNSLPNQIRNEKHFVKFLFFFVKHI